MAGLQLEVKGQRVSKQDVLPIFLILTGLISTHNIPTTPITVILLPLHILIKKQKLPLLPTLRVLLLQPQLFLELNNILNLNIINPNILMLNHSLTKLIVVPTPHSIQEMTNHVTLNQSIIPIEMPA